MNCLICGTPIGSEGMSPFAAFGGLPSPCCKVCFEANDCSIKDTAELAGKSLLLRATDDDLMKELGIK